jgi:hypothetical protein
MSKSRLKYGQARVEFFACRDEIQRLMAAGYDLKTVYSQLKEAGKISMSYSAVHRNFAKIIQGKNISRKKNKEPQAPQMPQTWVFLESPQMLQAWGPAQTPRMLQTATPAANDDEDSLNQNRDQ